MAKTATKTRWLLEIARGREPGRRYSLDHGETTIGNAPWETSHLSLADQEGDSPRRMAPRQAVLVRNGEALAIRDLDSPGGTFVNRQRLFTNQERLLKPDDVIQAGAVHLVVRHEAIQGPTEAKPGPANKPRTAPATPPPPPTADRKAPLAAEYAFPNGPTARTWDDFLTISAQRWAMVRDELTTGRIADHLRRVGRPDLLPTSRAGVSADDVLDEWLGRLPTTNPAAPELDVHPTAIVVPANSAGGVTKRTVRIANVGDRILRPTLAVEPAPGAPGAIRLAPGSKAKAAAIIDEVEVVLEIEPPAGVRDAALGVLVISAGGQTRRVGVRIEPPRVETIPDAQPAATEPGWSPTAAVDAPLAGLSFIRRLWLFPLVVLILRGLIELANRIPYLSTGGELKLIGAAALPAFAGAVVGWAAGMSGGLRDSIASTFAGSFIGLLASALIFASIRSVEGLFGSPWLSAAALGFGLAAASCLLVPPPRRNPSE